MSLPAVDRGVFSIPERGTNGPWFPIKAMQIARKIAKNTSAVSVALAKALLRHDASEPDPHSAHLAECKCFSGRHEVEMLEKESKASWKKGLLGLASLAAGLA